MTGTPGASGVAAGLASVRARIDAAARAAGRAPGDVVLVAVSKEVDAAAVVAALEAGQRDFGENRAQELVAKSEALERGDLAADVRWHFIGRIQRNKVKTVASRVALWHSVDRLEVGAEIARHAPGARVLVQVNVAHEEQKGGCAPEATGDLAGALSGLGLRVEGLMTVPPLAGDPCPHFAALRELAASLGPALPEGRPELSMGMSGDFEAAIAEGATIVRVGTAVFGPRPAGDPRPGGEP